MSAENPLVLYVDDEWANRVVFEQSFAPMFPTRTVASGVEALQVLASTEVGVLVADQRMPGMTGNELLERARDLHPRVVRIVLTAYGDLDPILRAVNEGLVARYILKPFDRGELETILSWALEAYAIGEREPAVQLRLLQTERLATIGSLTAALVHDLSNVLHHAQTDLKRLERLTTGAPALTRWVEEGRAPDDAELVKLADLARELPEVSRALRDSVTLLRDISAGAHRSLRPPTGEAPESDPRRAIADALALFRGNARDPAIRYDGPPRLPRVAMRGAELSQVLLNLLSNARAALGARGGHIVVSALELGAQIEIAVRDDGEGMTPEVRAKAGDLFFTTRDGGTGIGLSQCRRLVASARGTLTIESRPGEGTTVRIAIPIATSP